MNVSAKKIDKSLLERALMKEFEFSTFIWTVTMRGGWEMRCVCTVNCEIVSIFLPQSSSLSFNSSQSSSSRKVQSIYRDKCKKNSKEFFCEIFCIAAKTNVF